MTLELHLANLVLAHAPLAAVIGNRCHWDELPQGEPDPSIIMHMISGVAGRTYSGSDGLTPAVVQFDCRGATAAQRDDVATLLAARLDGYRGPFGDIQIQSAFRIAHRTRSERDQPSARFVAMDDYRIWWRPAA